jgi:hypothetical protein
MERAIDRLAKCLLKNPLIKPVSCEIVVTCFAEE